MDEEETTEEEGEKDTDANQDKGDKPTTPKVIIDANAAAERLEKANEERAKLLGREEELVARKHLGGGSEAGQITPEETEEDKQKAGAKEFFKGTQLEKDIEKL